ncbi:hypothetical protein HOD05_01000 [Candidatus Woesearchaeota archaeon]|jgi:hypothetical protein|nr:hypothetical protein [Candidatus Woesearchaeota archaeon]MBT4150985.1 hypothetical protein [Candidatus Woesearchaeota archaeon]MBT4433775.1 hypothetical protein [Candidatus Woesearchaeota archaeon]MBT7332658.1 hypothetical protein [Candidatus Woesearchaeota archaeon]
MRRHINRRIRSEPRSEGGNPFVIGFIALILVGIIFMAVTSENVEPETLGKAFEPNVFANNQVIPEDTLLANEISDAKLEHVMYLVENSDADFSVKLAVKKELLDVQALTEASCNLE